MIWSDKGLEWESFATIKEAKDHLFIQALVISSSREKEEDLELINQDGDDIGDE